MELFLIAILKLNAQLMVILFKDQIVYKTAIVDINKIHKLANFIKHINK